MKLILSLDGGGYRGLLQAKLLERLNFERPGVVRICHALAGTSAGAISASALAKGLSPSEVADLMEEVGREVFYNPWHENISELWGLRRAKHKNSKLKAKLKQVLGDTEVRDLKKKILITSFNMRCLRSGSQNAFYRPIVIHNMAKHSHSDMKLWEACLASSAAPTYFPPFSPAKMDSGLIDGGVWGNNPSMAIISQILRAPSRLKPSDISVLSVGTGYNMKSSRVKNASWGLYQWVKKGHLLDILTGDATTGAIHYYAETLLGPNYHRLQPHLVRPIDLDDARPKTTRKLKKIASEADLTWTLRWMEGFWNR